MSLWYESLGTSLFYETNKTRRMQEILRYFSMPEPRFWWESCLNDEKCINNYASVLAEVCKEIFKIKKWKDYSLFVAIAFTDMDYNEPYKHSIDNYYDNAKRILANKPEIKELGNGINNFLVKLSCEKCSEDSTMNEGIKKPVNMRFFLPTIKALKHLGDSGTSDEIKDYLIEDQKISENELEEKFKNGVAKIDNQFTWAKTYLKEAGFIKILENKLIQLTEEGRNSNFNENEIAKLIKKLHGDLIRNGKKNKSIVSPDESEITVVENLEHQKELLSKIYSLSPAGFEKLCQRFLRESGFTKVIVTGKSADGGIDGEGILEINPLVSLKVIFQSKRYKGTVSSPQVRDFRGAMQGRAEKAIIITTGRFTQEAKKEALRDGVPPIELVDGEKLVELFEQKELGLKRKIVYEIDEDFFDEFQ